MDRLISEQAVFKTIDGLKTNFTCYDWVTLDEVYSHVKAIPSAEPKIVPIAEIKFDDDMLHEIVKEAVKNIEIEPKEGHWEWVQYDSNPNIGNWHCSECRSIVIGRVNKKDKGGIPFYKYCPQCGVRMD